MLYMYNIYIPTTIFVYERRRNKGHALASALHIAHFIVCFQQHQKNRKGFIKETDPSNATEMTSR